MTEIEAFNKRVSVLEKRFVELTKENADTRAAVVSLVALLENLSPPLVFNSHQRARIDELRRWAKGSPAPWVQENNPGVSFG